MNTDLGKVTKKADGYEVRFERTFPHHIQKVWDAITRPENLKYWFTDMEFELRPGGQVAIRFRDGSDTVSYGEVVSVDPPHKFVWTWEHELAVWELFAEGPDRCRISLTYSRLDPQFAADAPAGWHVLLERLEGMLNGQRIIHPFGTEGDDPEFQGTRQRYSSTVYEAFPELQRFRPIVIERVYQAPLEKVWKAITDKEQMKHWYFDLSDFTPEVGFKFQFPGQGHKGEQYLHLCEVTAVEVGKKLTYSWSYEGHEGISYVSFELEALGSQQTSLKLTHRGLHSFPEHPDFARTSFQQGWTELIGNLLKAFVEA